MPEQSEIIGKMQKMTWKTAETLGFLRFFLNLIEKLSYLDTKLSYGPLFDPQGGVPPPKFEKMTIFDIFHDFLRFPN